MWDWVCYPTLETLEALYYLSIQRSLSLFCQSMCLINIYEVTKFLIESFEVCENVERKLQRFLELSTKYFENVFPLDCSKALEKNMITLRKTEISQDLLEEVIVKNICVKGKLTYGEIGRVMMIWLGLGTPRAEIHKKIDERFKKSDWKTFIQILLGSMQLESSGDSPSENCVNKSRDLDSAQMSISFGSFDESAANALSDHPRKISLIDSFHTALRDAYNANWRTEDYISPHCFWYLVERFFILVCHSRGFFFTSKYSFVEWLMYVQSDAYPSANLVSDKHLSLETAFDFIVMMAEEFLCENQETVEWIQRSNLSSDRYYPLLVLRLVLTICLLCLNSGKYFDVLSQLLCQNHIRSQLPKQFNEAFHPARTNNYLAIDVNVIAEAFKRIGNPVVIVRLKKNSAKISVRNAVYVDTGKTPKKEDIMRIFFPRTTQRVGTAVNRDLPSTANNQRENVILASDVSKDTDQNINPKNGRQGETLMRWKVITYTLDLLKLAESRNFSDPTGISTNVSKIMVELEEIINTCYNVKISNDPKKENFCKEANSLLLELQQLHHLLGSSDAFLPENKQKIQELLKSMQSRRPILENFLNELTVSENDKEADDSGNNLPQNAASGSQSNDDSKAAAESNKGKGKNKNKSKKGKWNRRK